MATTIRDWLEIDHRRLERLLDDSDREGQFDAASFAAFRARLLRHIGIEEKIVFAAVRDALGQPMSRARQIRVEHAAIASLLVPAPDLALVGELRALLRAHDELEEGRDGVYAETGLLESFPAGGLKVRWRAPPGGASPARSSLAAGSTSPTPRWSSPPPGSASTASTR